MQLYNLLDTIYNSACEHDTMIINNNGDSTEQFISFTTFDNLMCKVLAFSLYSLIAKDQRD